MRSIGPLLSRLLLIGFGILCLVLVELVLRLAWAPEPAGEVWTSIRPLEVQEGVARTKKSFAGALRPVQVAVPKPSNQFRIICLGGSTTFGYPYDAAAAWPAELQLWFENLYPDRQVKVINLGGNSYGSERVLGLVNGLAELEPDLVIVALGDTEFVEDSYRVALAETARQGGLAKRLRSLYLARLISAAVPERRGRRVVDVQEGAGDVLFAPVVDGTLYRADQKRRREVEQQFSMNLQKIIARTRALGADLLLATLPANLRDWPPDRDDSLPVDPVEAERWQETLKQGDRMLSAGRLEEGLQRWLDAAELWSGNAGFCYRLGLLYLSLEQPRQALLWLEKARDLDPAPVRGLSSMHEIIRTLGLENNLPVADLAGDFSEHSPQGIVGGDFLLDYAHPNRHGHRLIARQVWAVLQRSFPVWGGYDQTVFEGLNARLSEQVDELPELDPDLAFVWGQVFARKGHPDKSIAMYRLAHDGGYRPYATVPLAQQEAERGRLDMARMLLEEVVRDFPDFVESYPVLAWVSWMQGDLDSAAGRYRQALERGFGDELTYGGFAEVLLKLGRHAEAEKVVLEGLSVHPGSCRLVDLRVRLRLGAGSTDLARRDAQALLQKWPNCRSRLSFGVQSLVEEQR